MNRRTRISFSIIALLGLALLLLQLRLITYYNTSVPLPDENTPVILWWTPFGTTGQIRQCSENSCFFTHDRTFEQHPNLKSILFYGTNFRVYDLPTRRPRYVRWGLLHEESPRNNPILVHEEALNVFNYSSTFSRFSDVPLTLNHLPNSDELISTKYFLTTAEKTVLMKKYNLAPVLYIQSDCDTASNRDSYVLELMKHIPVDSYGSCMNNRQLPESLKNNHLDVLNTDQFLSFVARYKFTLAFENAICTDYITEKLWRPLIVGSVPIYYGSESFEDWLPNNKSAISVRDFKSPEELAHFLLNLMDNGSEYEKHLTHKLRDRDNRISNVHLQNALKMRLEGTTVEFGYYVEEFECYVCRKIQSLEKESESSIVTKKHYDCPIPTNPPSMAQKRNWWIDQWNIGKCGAKLLAHYVSNNIHVNKTRFEEEQFKLYRKNAC